MTRALLVLAAVVMLVLAPGAADADGYVAHDAADDLVSFAVGSAHPTVVPVQGRAQGDVVESAVLHRRRQVVMRLRYRELEPVGAAAGHVFLIRTNRVTRLVTVYAGPGYWDGKVVVEKGTGTTVHCAVRAVIDYAADTVTVVVPRSCLGNPRWVRVGMAGLTFDSLDRVFADDARANGSVAEDPVLGPRVRR